MRKVTVLAFWAGILLSASFAYAQDVVAETEAEDEVHAVEFSIIPRYDISPAFPLHKTSRTEISWNVPEVYTLFEGAPCDWFSYSMSNHWASADTRALYVFEDGRANLMNTGTEGLNWLDWANMTFSIARNWGTLSLTVGKDVVLTGGFEVDAYDFDAHAEMSSYFWNEYNVYQWGGKLAYTLPDGTSTFAAQLTTSPLGTDSIRDGLYAFNLQWRGEYDWYSSIWSTNFFQCPTGKFMNVISLGNQFYVGDFTIGLDYMNRVFSPKKFFNQEMGIRGTLIYNWQDKLEVECNAGYDRMNGTYDWFYDCQREDVESYWHAGAALHYFPLKDRSLRLHALLAYNNYYFEDHLEFSVGVLYNFNLTQLIRNCKK